jgi:hypothetical protein
MQAGVIHIVQQLKGLNGFQLRHLDRLFMCLSNVHGASRRSLVAGSKLWVLERISDESPIEAHDD